MSKKQENAYFENYKRDLQRVLDGDPMETSEEAVRLFLEIKRLTPQELVDPEFKLLQVQLMQRISGYQDRNGDSGLKLALMGQALEYHQMMALGSIDQKYQEEVSGHEVLEIVGQLNEHQTEILRATGIPPETNVLEYLYALRELKKHHADVWWDFGFPVEVRPVEYLGILKDFDVYKTSVLKHIPKKNLPGGVTWYAIICAMRDMQVIKGDDNKTIQLNFAENTDVNVKKIITDAACKRSGIKSENRLDFIVVDKEGKSVGAPEQCDINSFSQRCKSILSEHPDCYILIDGNLDAKRLQKTNFDFSYMKRIIVNGDFICSKNNRVFPYMVKGTFDCQAFSKGDITKNTVLPFARTINLGHSITGLDVLIDILEEGVNTILPAGIQTLIVEPAMIRENSQYLDIAKKLVEVCPGLTITDTKGNKFGQKKVESKKTEPQKPEKPAPVKKTLEQKIPGKHMGVKDIIKYCRKERKNDFGELSDDALKRLVQQVLSNQRKNGIEKKMMKLADGTPVVCIDASQIDDVCTEIIKIMKEDAAREELKSKPVDTPIKKDKTPKRVTKRDVEQPISITKYISYDLYKNIETSSQHKIDDVLRDINEINLDPIDPKMQDQTRIHIIKNGVRTVSTNVKRDGGACLVQSVDSSIKTDKKRIVWAVANGPDGEMIIVGIGFCDDHDPTKKSKKQGYDYLRQFAFKKRTYTKEELSKYMKVEDLLNANTTSDFLIQAAIEAMEHKH